MSSAAPEISDELRAWLEAQPVFFVATAPLSADGLLNLSPKGDDSFRVLAPASVAYLDYTGSGAETIAHLRENGRIVIMFCAFDGPPRIIRIHGRGEVIQPSHPDFPALVARFPVRPATRSIIRVAVARVAKTCGYVVPLMEFTARREQLDKWAENKGPAGLEEYRRQKNRTSLDGLPAWIDEPL